MSGPLFWHGQVWRLVTYALVPRGIGDLLTNCVAVIILGGVIGTPLVTRQLWLYCLVTVAGAGSAKVIWQSASPLALDGAAPMTFALLIAWGF